MNIIPECLTVEKNEEHTLKIMTKGWYLLHIYELEIDRDMDDEGDSREENLVWIEINNGIKYPIADKKLFNLAAET